MNKTYTKSTSLRLAIIGEIMEIKFNKIKINEKTGDLFIDDIAIQGVAENGVSIVINENIKEINIKIINFESLEIINN